MIPSNGGGDASTVSGESHSSRSKAAGGWNVTVEEAVELLDAPPVLSRQGSGTSTVASGGNASTAATKQKAF